MDQKSTGPTRGDIIVHKRHTSADLYVLGVFERASQVGYRAYPEAMKRAAEFAIKDRVDAWYTEDGETYRRLARHRRGQRGEDSTES